MSAKQHAVQDLDLDASAPTLVNLNQLYTWIIWQFPRPAKEDGYYGAVHPPRQNHTWYPAIIHTHKKSVQIYAHLDTQFRSPEEAVAHFEKAG